MKSNKGGVGNTKSNQKVHTLTQKEWDFANKITKNTVVGEPVWISKFPHDTTHGKTEPRLLIVGKYQIFTAHSSLLGGFKISKQAHIYDIQKMGHLEGQDNVIEITFYRDDKHLFDIRFANTPSANIEQSVGLSVLFTVQCARMQISYKFPPQMLHYMPERSLDLLKQMPKPWERMLPAQAHVETYTATCMYEDHPAREETVTHLFTQLVGISWKTDASIFDLKTIDLTACFGNCRLARERSECYVRAKRVLRASEASEASAQKS